MVEEKATMSTDVENVAVCDVCGSIRYVGWSSTDVWRIRTHDRSFIVHTKCLDQACFDRHWRDNTYDAREFQKIASQLSPPLVISFAQAKQVLSAVFFDCDFRPEVVSEDEEAGCEMLVEFLDDDFKLESMHGQLCALRQELESLRCERSVSQE